ncbi:MAG: 3-deoxy-8-phosphooctulonate synthase [Planctomycetaceae bacterium]|nr:3-deoxy-8-phosphooctulonate synthase [Planctomycetaceae bacterium]
MSAHEPTTTDIGPHCDVGSYRIGLGHPLTLIAGPCVIENLDLTRRIAEQLAVTCQRLGIHLIFKASYDKANRTSVSGYRGVGQAVGLEVLDRIRHEFGVPVTTDVHETIQVPAVAQVCELLQIPAFLARQTDLLLAAAATGRAVNVKKGQFMAPEDMRHVRDKLVAGGCHNVLLTERGTFFGYGRLVNDFTGLAVMRQFAPVVFDATHSVQRPSGMGSSTGGNREYVAPLARAAIAFGIDALFLETHPEPDQSPSDGPNMIPLAELPQLLEKLLALRQVAA